MIMLKKWIYIWWFSYTTAMFFLPHPTPPTPPTRQAHGPGWAHDPPSPRGAAASRGPRLRLPPSGQPDSGNHWAARADVSDTYIHICICINMYIYIYIYVYMCTYTYVYDGRCVDCKQRSVCSWVELYVRTRPRTLLPMRIKAGGWARAIFQKPPIKAVVVGWWVSTLHIYNIIMYIYI